MTTAAEAIREAMVSLGDEALISDVEGYIAQHYPARWRGGRSRHRWQTSPTLEVSLRSIPTSQRFLVRVSRGRYRLR